MTMADQECERKKKYEEVVEALRPDAKEFVDQMLKDPMKTTKNNYGKVMSFLSQLKPPMGQLFLMAMVKEGYPKITADQLKQLMGW
jgi:hypothetical protein